MERRRFLGWGFAACLLAMPPAALAQGKVYRIGYLSIRPSLVDQDESFVKGLRELGYVEGRNIVIEWRFFNDKAKTLNDLAAQLVSSHVDCIVTVGITATRAARAATGTVPIVMANASDDPVRYGLVKTLARPGGNVTGFIDISSDLTAKRLQFLKALAPRATRIGILWDSGTPVGSAEFRGASVASAALGLEVVALEIKRPEDFPQVFQQASDAQVHALYIASFGNLFHSNRSRVLGMATKTALPTIYTLPEWASAGGLMSYSADVNDQHRRAAAYVDRILKGSEPADLPVQQPIKFDLIVNLRSAQRMGITVPADLLAQANKILQ